MPSSSIIPVLMMITILAICHIKMAIGTDCKASEIHTECARDILCQPSCDYPDGKPCPRSCTLNACECKKGYVRDKNLTCIEASQCSTSRTKRQATCGENELSKDCAALKSCQPSCNAPNGTVCPRMCDQNSCVCKDGFIRASKKNETCIEKTQCSELRTQVCATNEKYSSCVNPCQASCEEPNRQPCQSFQCMRGCMDSLSFKICSTCEKENIVKPKLGIHPCHGCQLAFCLIHLTKHREELLQKFDLVILQRDELYEFIFKNNNLSNENVEKSLQDIGEWETKMHEVVHQTAEENRENVRLEFIKYINEIKERYDEFTKELIKKHENDNFFENDIKQLSSKLDQFKQEIDKIIIVFQLNPINQQEKSSISYLNNSQLLLERQMISLHDRNCFFLAASNTHILAYILSINRNENRLVLYNISDGNELRSNELDVRLGNVCDIIYAETLNHCFLVVCRQAILIYDCQLMSFTILPELKPIDELPFWSIAVSSNTNDAFVNLDSNGFIERWSTETHPKWKLIKRWKIKEILKDSDQGIRMIRMCNKKNELAIPILQQDKYWRIDIFDFDLQLIRHGRNLSISNEIDKSGFGCRLLVLPDDNDETWLLSERTTRSLWYVNQSILKQIDKDINSVCSMINNEQQRKIVVSYSNEPKRIEIFNF